MARKKKKNTKKTVVSYRATDEHVADLDDYVAELRETQPGGNWTRSSAAMNLATIKLREWKEAK